MSSAAAVRVRVVVAGLNVINIRNISCILSKHKSWIIISLLLLCLINGKVVTWSKKIKVNELIA